MKFYIFLNLFRLVPAFFLYKTSKQKATIKFDIERWCEILKISGRSFYSFSVLVLRYKEFRNYLGFRMPKIKKRVFFFLFRPLECLKISCENIGKGLFIQHGIGTIIAAQQIGENCWINQNVTIGYNIGDDRKPIIGNNVEIKAGAVVAGNIKIGNNALIGANAVVVKNIPDNMMAFGFPLVVKSNKYIRK